MTNDFHGLFSHQYDSHLKHLKLKGLQPETIDALSEAQLTEYFSFRSCGVLTKKPDVVVWRCPMLSTPGLKHHGIGSGFFPRTSIQLIRAQVLCAGITSTAKNFKQLSSCHWQLRVLPSWQRLIHCGTLLQRHYYSQAMTYVWRRNCLAVRM